MKIQTKIMMAFLVAAISATAAFATDVPAGMIVTRAGVEFAYVDPCSPFLAEGSCNASGQDLVMHDGWHLTTATEFLAGFTGFRDLYNAFDGSNQSYFGLNNMCASQYFNSGWSHCDGSDILGGWVHNAPVSWGGSEVGWEETFVTRGVVGTPEPSSLILLGSGLLALALRKRVSAK